MNDFVIPGIILGFSLLVALYYGYRTPTKAHKSIADYEEKVEELSTIEIEKEEDEDETQEESGFNPLNLIMPGFMLVATILFMGPIANNVFSSVNDTQAPGSGAINVANQVFSDMNTIGSIAPLVVTLTVVIMLFGVIGYFATIGGDTTTKKKVTRKKIRY